MTYTYSFASHLLLLQLLQQMMSYCGLLILDNQVKPGF